VNQKVLAYIGLFIAVISSAWAAIFVRFAAEASPLVIAFYRMLVASIFWIPFYWIWPVKKKVKPSNRDMWLMIVAGLALCFHFATWITSLTYTTVSSSVFLILTLPIMIAVAAHFFLGERLNRWHFFAFFLTLTGAFLIVGGDLKISGDYLIGDLLALAGAFFAGVYFFIARVVRPDKSDADTGIPLTRYLPLVYFVATVGLFLICIINGEKFVPFSNETWWALLALGLIPTVIGHSLYNWVLKHLPVLPVNISLVGEPIGASILAFLFFAENPTMGLFLGSPLLILAVLLVFLKPPQIKSF